MKNKIIYFFFALLLIGRFIYLDQDVPGYFISGISQEDEAYYSTEGINLYNLDHGRYLKGYEHNNMAPLLLYSTPLTYLSLKIFGNTYWGLRVPVVLISILVILLLHDILNRLKVPKIYTWLITLYLATDFYFFLFSRFQNPQIYSIAAITLILWTYFRFGAESKVGLILIGLFSSLAVLVVYLYNAFFLGALGLFFVILSVKHKRLFYLLYFSIGIFLSALFFIVCVEIWGSSIIEFIKVLTFHGGGVVKYETTSIMAVAMKVLKGAALAIFQILPTNFFRYNLPLLFFFLISTPVLIHKVFKEKNETAFLFLLSFILQYLQLVFIASYPFKKLIVLMPIVILTIVFCIPAFEEYYNSGLLKKKILAFIVAIVALLGCLYNFKINKDPNFWAGFEYGYFVNTPKWFDILNIIFLFTTFVLFLLFTFKQYLSMNFRYLFFLPLIASTFLIIKYCILEKKFEVRDALIDMKPIIENKVLITGFPHAHQFYSNCIPALSGYTESFAMGDQYKNVVDSLFKNGIAEYKIEKKFKHEKPDSSSNFVLTKKYSFSFYDYYLLKYVKTGQ